MNRFFFTFILIINFASCNSQSKESRKNNADSANDLDPTITLAIQNSLGNLNPYEYAICLPELCALIKKGSVTKENWKRYIDSLNAFEQNLTKDTLTNTLATQTPGLISSQINFLLDAIAGNKPVSEKYEDEIEILLQNTQSNNFTMQDSAARITDVSGEANFWYFVQLEGCNFVTRTIENNIFTKQLLRTTAGNLSITSTYKTRYALQKRKVNDIQNKLRESNDVFCIELSELINKRVITLQDNNKDFFEEHPNWDLERIF
jgi:hypothetical protein